MKKLFCILICTCALFAFFVMNVSAETLTGKCGDNATWMLDTDTGVLTISGNGEMESSPWRDYKINIQIAIIEYGITNICESAFDSCDRLTAITIPQSITIIGKNAFLWCDSLAQVYYQSDITSWIKISFKNRNSSPFHSSYNYEFNKCELYCNNALVTNVVVDKEITDIGYAFCGCKSLTSIIIPEGVKDIKDSAFEGCIHLNKVELPNTLCNIGIAAFEKCSSLVDIQIPSNVTEIAIFAFRECSSISSIIVPEGITRIYEYTFYDCKNLKTLTLPRSLKRVGTEAFSWCSNLSNITCLSADVNFEEDVFFGATKGCEMLCYKSSTADKYATSIGMTIKYIEDDCLTHIGGEPITTATCTNDGVTEIKCIYCANVISSTATPALGHSMKETVLIAPTTSTVGQLKRACTTCGYTEYEEIPMLEAVQGDLDGDGVVSVKDVIASIKAVLNGTALEGADMNGDGKLTLIDVLRVLKAATA